jgi:hypothetical protein
LWLAVASWAKGALAGLAKGAPFSLCITKHHFAAVVAAGANADNDDLSQVLDEAQSLEILFLRIRLKGLLFQFQIDPHFDLSFTDL